MRSKTTNITTHDIWVDAPYGRLFVRTWSPDVPSGLTPIILLHDSLGSVELWRDFPETLCSRTGRKVIAYDRLGFGKSDQRSDKLSLDFVSREAETDFAAVKQGLGVDKFVLFGHSVGGGMAVHCAARFGDACVGLITESAQAFVEDRTVQGIEAARDLFKGAGQVDRLKKYHGDKTRWVLDAWIDSWLDPAFSSWSLKSVLPQVKCPTLVIHGVDDEYGSPVHPELIGELVGGPVQVEIMPDTRHVPHRENASAVIEMVAGFAKSLT